jgi:hypothetical protein
MPRRHALSGPSGEEPMFATGNEIRSHFSPLRGDVRQILDLATSKGMQIPSTKEGQEALMWKAKGNRARRTGLAADIAENGVTAPVSIWHGLATPTIVGGHHRVSVAGDKPIPLVHDYSPDVHEAIDKTIETEAPSAVDFEQRRAIARGQQNLLKAIFGGGGNLNSSQFGGG